MSTKKRNNIIHLFLSRLIRRIKGFIKRIDHTAAKRAANVTGKHEDVTKRGGITMLGKRSVIENL